MKVNIFKRIFSPMQPLVGLTLLVLVWLHLNFRDSSLLYYYWLLNLLSNVSSDGYNILAMIGCLAPIMAVVYFSSNFLLTRINSSLYAVIRIGTIKSLLTYTFVPLLLNLFYYLCFEYIAVISIDLIFGSMPIELSRFINVTLTSLVVRYISILAVVMLCNLFTFISMTEYVCFIPMFVYAIGLYSNALIGQCSFLNFMPWNGLIQEFSLSIPCDLSINYISVLFSCFICIFCVLGIIYQIKHRDIIQEAL